MRKPSMEEVLEEYGGNAWGYASKAWASDRRFSDDLEQEAMVALLEAWERFDWSKASHPGEFGAYLKKVVNDKLMDFRGSMGFSTTGSGRSIYRGARLHETAAMEDVDEPMEWSDDSSDWLDAIMSSMDVLTDRQRQVIGLYYLDGILSDTRVADVLGIRRQVAEKVRKAGEAKLRTHLGAM